MDQQAKKIMEEIENNSSISMDQIYDVAYAVQHEDLSDEMTVRSLVRRLVNLAGRPVSPEKEDQIVNAILQQDMPVSIDALDRFF